MTPYNWNSQAGYRRELRPDLGIDVSFLYNRGYDHIGIVNTNAGIPGTASLTGANAVRPDPNFVNKSFYTNFGEIRYKALLVDLRKRLSHGLPGRRRLHAFEDGQQLVQLRVDHPDSGKPGVELRSRHAGSPSSDRRPRRVLPAVGRSARCHCRLPERSADRRHSRRPRPRRRRHHRRLGERGRSCRQAAVNCSASRYSRNNVRELSLEEANRLRGLFGLAPIAAFENNPKYFNVDLTLQKRIRFGSHAIRLTAEVFNLLNTPQRTLPDSNILSGTFGRYTAVEQPRFAQFTFQYQIFESGSRVLQAADYAGLQRVGK